ncbi:MAG: HDOD domain-containing protein [Phycisphaerales bacterium]|nr:HDOD domain-containing protein [Phycisphaerales bacterium]
MRAGSTKLIEILNCPSLPSLPTVAVQLLELTSDPDVKMKDIAQLVSTDQALSAKVLKTVNSSYYGLSSSCGSIDRALGYLGLNTVKSLVLGFSLVETTALAGDQGFDLMGHWRRAIMGATGARAIAKQLKLSDPDEVFTAALFQDMGMLAAFTMLKTEYSGVIDDTPHRIVCAAEQDAYGFDHTEVGEALAELWKLPKDICDAIRYHHDPDKAQSGDIAMVRAVSLGTLAADAMSSKSSQVAIRRLESQSIAWFGVSSGLEVEKLLEEIAESSKTLAKMFDQDIGEIPNPAMLMAQAQDKGMELQINAQKQADALAREAVTDGLTQIANRKRFDTEIGALFGEALSGGRQLAVLFFDADRFKSVNDNYGHAAGDVVLVELAKRATSVVGDGGLVCRYGGEEFVVLLPDKGVEEGERIAERIRKRVADTPFDLSSVEGVPDELPVTVSVGVSAMDAGEPGRLDNPAELVEEADKGVYAAKSAGRNMVQVYGRFTTIDLGGSKVSKPSQPQDFGASDSGNNDPFIHGNTLLLIEDDALAATLVMSLLKRKTKMAIQWISNGDEAQKILAEIAESQQNPYSAVVCDLDLPGSNGLDILRAMRGIEALDKVPFYVVTANDDSDLGKLAEDLGATNFMNKMDLSKDLGAWLNLLAGADQSSGNRAA